MKLVLNSAPIAARTDTQPTRHPQAVTDAHQQQGSTHGSPGRPAAQAMPAAAPAAHGPARPPRQEDLESLRAAIAANKAELAPQVQQLRAARERFQVGGARGGGSRVPAVMRTMKSLARTVYSCHG